MLFNCGIVEDSQESSPTPQFKSINSSALCLLHSPTLTSIHDYWKTIALTRQAFVGKVMSLLFNTLSVMTFLPKKQASFNFTAADTICSDFGAQETTICHCFYLFPIYLPRSGGTGCHDLSFLNVEIGPRNLLKN